MAQTDNENEAAKAQPSWARTAGGAHDQAIEENWLFRLRKERFKSRRTGKEHDYYVIHLADAVHVVALTPDDEVLLVRQFRAGSDRDSLEIPGGLVDHGEDSCAAGGGVSCSKKLATRVTHPCCSAHSGRIPRC